MNLGFVTRHFARLASVALAHLPAWCRNATLATAFCGLAGTAAAGPVLIKWEATATGSVGTLSASGSMVVDSSEIGSDISLSGGLLNGVRLQATLHDGSRSVNVSHRQGSLGDHEMALRFTNTDLANLQVQLIDTNTSDGANDSLVFEFSPWYTALGGTCNCDVALLVLHGSNAQYAPSPFFVSAAPADLKGSYTLTASAVPDSLNTLAGLGAGLVALAIGRSRVRPEWLT